MTAKEMLDKSDKLEYGENVGTPPVYVDYDDVVALMEAYAKQENQELKELLQQALDDNLLTTFLIETVKKYGIEYSEVHPINITDKKQ